MPGFKRQEITAGLRKLYNEEPQGVLLTKYYLGHQIKEDEMGGASWVQGNIKQALEL
jgi:hypothetical protein